MHFRCTIRNTVRRLSSADNTNALKYAKYQPLPPVQVVGGRGAEGDTAVLPGPNSASPEIGFDACVY